MKPQSIWNPEFRHICDALRHRLTVFTPAELAGMLSVSKRTILAAIRSGKLRAHRINRRVIQIESREAAEWWERLAE
jgi:excisionase family DNA binding protein